MRAGVTAVHVGVDIGSNQIAEPHTCCPGVLHLFGCAEAKDRILNRALEAAKLTVGKHAGDPVAVELPVIAGADRAKPTVAALALIDGEGQARRGDPGARVGIPDAAAAAAKDVEAG